MGGKIFYGRNDNFIICMFSLIFHFAFSLGIFYGRNDNFIICMFSLIFHFAFSLNLFFLNFFLNYFWVCYM